MKKGNFDFDGLILVIAGISVAVILSFGVVTVIKAALKPALKKPIHNSYDAIHDQKLLMEENKRKEEQMMRDLKRKTEDSKRQQEQMMRDLRQRTQR